MGRKSTLFTIILIISIAFPIVGFNSLTIVQAAEEKVDTVVNIYGANIDVAKLEMAKVLAQTPTAEVIEASNPLYTSGFSTYTVEGKEIAKLHEKLATVVIGKITELDTKYQKVLALNADFDSNMDKLFATWCGYAAGADKGDQLIKGWYEVEKKLYRDYLDFKAMELIMRAQVDSLRNSLAELKKKENVPVNQSLAQSQSLIMLLGKFTTLSQVYRGKYTVLFFRALAAHTLEQQPDAKLPKEIANELQPMYAKEAELIAQILDADNEIKTLELQIAYGFSGLQAFGHEVLKISIATIEGKMPQYQEQLTRLKADSKKQEVAEIADQALQFYRLILDALKETDASLDSYGKPKWLTSAIEGDQSRQYAAGSILLFFLPQPVYADSSVWDALGTLSNSAINLTSSATGAVWNGGKAVVNGVKDGVVAVGGAAVEAPRMAFLGVDGISIIAADQWFAWTQGLDPKDQVAITQNLEALSKEFAYGKEGGHASANALASFDLAEKAPELGLQEIFGKSSYIATVGGYIGGGMVGFLTGLGKGVVQVSDPNATWGQIAEGTLNIGLSVIGGTPVAAAAGKVANTIAGKAIGAGGKLLGFLKEKLFTTVVGGNIAPKIGAAINAVKNVAVKPAKDLFNAFTSKMSKVVFDLTNKVKDTVNNLPGTIKNGVNSIFSKETKMAVKEGTKEWFNTAVADMTKDLGSGIIQGVKTVVVKIADGILPGSLLGGWIDGKIVGGVKSAVDWIFGPTNTAAGQSNQTGGDEPATSTQPITTIPSITKPGTTLPVIPAQPTITIPSTTKPGTTLPVTPAKPITTIPSTTKSGTTLPSIPSGGWITTLTSTNGLTGKVTEKIEQTTDNQVKWERYTGYYDDGTINSTYTREFIPDGTGFWGGGGQWVKEGLETSYNKDGTIKTQIMWKNGQVVGASTPEKKSDAVKIISAVDNSGDYGVARDFSKIKWTTGLTMMNPPLSVLAPSLPTTETTNSGGESGDDGGGGGGGGGCT